MDETFLQDLQVPFTTPDLCELEGNEHLLFDCRVRKTDNVVCSAYTVERMSLFIRNEDHLPLPVRMRFMPRARIGGALYRVTTEEIVELDRVRDNRLSFERKSISVIVPFLDKKKHREFQVLPNRVWFYTAISDVWEERIHMNQPKYNITPENPDIVLAKRYVDNTSLLNNHYRSSPKRIEEYFDKPKQVLATQEVAMYVSRKNAEAVKKPFWKLNRR